ncbi:MAG TPA: GspE/PulE family protein, partial [Tepidisphaeraceae bacterium]|nr:GspE/PulE family protein [Tepidisphaeraceae bacterium]
MTDQATPLIDVARLPVEQGVARLISHAVSLPASDLFFGTNEHNVSVSARRLGMIQTVSVLPPDIGKRHIAHIKTLAQMDVSERRRPLDGRWIHRLGETQVVDLRINMIPTLFGEDLAIRILSREANLFALNGLGMTDDQFESVSHMLDSPSGLILMTGPTGSGKTATLYASLVRLNNGRQRINTIEDPIEFTIDGLRQSQVNPAVDLHFAALLRGVLRQSPDVIMIGEVRDAETADTAVRAANSGHLVFATVHAPVAAAATQSMLSLGIHPHFLSTSLRGIVSQRLVRTLCPDCKSSFDLSDAPHTFDEIRQWLAPGEGTKLYASRGCPKCQQTGYCGRTGIFEVMPITQTLRGLIAEGRPSREIRAAAIKDKMLEFRQAALLKVAKGITSTE